MKYSLFILAAAATNAAHIIHRQAPYNSSTSAQLPTSRISTSSHSPASVVSAGTASVTNSANVTRTRTSDTTSSPASTCCYLWPAMIGVNTWWSSSITLPVATVITTWIKYNDTIVPANSTTITVANATSFYGSLGGMLQPTYSRVGPPTSTYTLTQCEYSTTAGESCTESTTTTRTLWSSTYYARPTTSIPGVPGDLLPAVADLYYGATFIDNATAATFTNQSLTIHSPTPFLNYGDLGIWTSMDCVQPTVVTSTSVFVRTTIDGTLVQTTSFYPTYTSTPRPSGVLYAGGNMGSRLDGLGVARPFPDGDYSDFNFTAWMEGIAHGGPSSVDGYMFEVDDDLAEWFASIPMVQERLPDFDVAQCTPLMGDGEPSVHVPVNQLIDTAHVTVTRPGTLPRPTTPKTTEAEPTPEPTVEPTSDDGPPPGPTTSPNDQPPETTDQTQPGPTDTPDTPEDEPAETPGQTQPQPTGSPNDEPSDEEPSEDNPSDQSPGQPNVEPTQDGNEPQPTNNLNPPDIISIIQQATPSPTAGGQAPAPAAQPTSKAIGDAIASVIGLVPAPNNDQPQDSPPQPGSQQADGQLPNEQDNSPPVISLGNAIVTADSNSGFDIGGQTLSPGGPAVTAGGTTFAFADGGSAVVVDGVTTPINAPNAQAAQTPAAQITVGDNIVTADRNSNFVIGSQTLAPGGSAINEAGTTFSLAPSADAVVANGQTSPIDVPVAAQQTPQAEITVGGTIITADSNSRFVVGSQTLAPGGPEITVDGSTYSLAPYGSAIVVNGVTSTLPNVPGLVTGALDGSQGSIMELILPGTTLLPGSSAVISGTTYSLPATGGAIYINGESSALLTASPGSPITLPNGIVATPTLVSDLVIGSQTLLPGSAITVSGTTYSLSGSEVVVAAASTTYTEDIDDFEATATSGRRTSTGTSSPTSASTGSSGSPSDDSAPGPTSTSGASRKFCWDVLCVGVLSVAVVLCSM